MPLSDTDIQRIGHYVKGELPGWLADIAPWTRGTELLDRAVRIEDELTSLRESMALRFEASDRRFEDLRKAMDKRFDHALHTMDKRFDDVLHAMDKRFEDVNKRFDDVNRRFEDANKRFDDVNQRFEDTNKRFDDVNKRFDDVNKRFDDANRRFNNMQWLIGIGIVALSTLMSVYQFLA